MALESGAEDYRRDGDLWEITCDPGAFELLKGALEKSGIPTESAELSKIPNSTVALDINNSRRMLSLLEALEEHDDIQHVFSNFDIPEDLMASAE